MQHDATFEIGGVHGQRRVVTAAEIGFERADAIVRRSSSIRMAPVRAILEHAEMANTIFAQQIVRSSHVAGAIVARTRAIAATGIVPDGQAVSAVYAADFSAMLAADADTLRFGTNSIFLSAGEGADVFGIVGPWHISERMSFLRAEFEDVTENEVDVRTLRGVRDWMRGRELVWMKLSAPEATRAAHALASHLKEIEAIDRAIAERWRAGDEVDPRLLRQRRVLKAGIEAYGVFFGYQSAVDVEREPSIAALIAARGADAVGPAA